MPVTPGAMCSTHASVLAVDVCARCGRFCCAECADVGLDGETSYCVDCRTRLLEAPPTPRANRALVFGCISLACATTFPLFPPVLLGAFVAAFVSLVVGISERRAVRTNQAPVSSLSRVKWAWIASALGVVIASAATVWLVGVITRRWRW